MDRLHELSLLLAILDEGSLAGAGRKLRCSPAAVTRILGGMERRLGVRLFERTTRSVSITEAGRRLADHARALLSGYEDAVRETLGERAVPSGTVRVSAPYVFGRLHVAPTVAGFLEANAQARVELHLSNRIVDLVEERIDVAVRIGRIEDDSRLVAKTLGEVKRVLVASPAYIGRRGLPGSPGALAAHELIVQLAGDVVPDWSFARPGGKPVTFTPAARFAVNQAETAIEAACAGHGIIRALSYQVRDLVASKRLVRILQAHEPPPLPVSLVYRDPQYLAARVRAFVDHAAPRLAGRLSGTAPKKSGPPGRGRPR